MVVYAIAAGSFKRSSGAPDAAEHCAPAKCAPELMTGNMPCRFRVARHDGRPGLVLENTGRSRVPIRVLFENRSENQKI
jgi:hypothetical protein